MLTATKINAAKPKEKAYKLTDALGLHLFVSPAGGKLWRLKYRFGRDEKTGKPKEKLLSLGAYPEISLVEARERRDSARKKLANGIDPGEAKRLEKALLAKSDGFELVAREWHEKFKSNWSGSYAAEIIERLELDVFPWIGDRSTMDLSNNPPAMLELLQRIEKRGARETLRKVKIICSSVFRYAVGTGRAHRDPTVDLRGAFAPAVTKHFPAITDPKELAGVLRTIDGYGGSFPVRCALQLTPMLFVRPGELRHAEWPEFNFTEKIWLIPAAKMKMDQDHIVPLPDQAISIIKELKPLTGSCKYLFPSCRSNSTPMSANTVNAAFRALGYDKDQVTAHGFRATARTILDEVLYVRVEYIEHQLSHKVKDANGRAYNRTTHLEERRKMMQLWADYLDGLKAGAKVLPFKRTS
ncbi:MAG: DUF4102 domain-containing protein [Anaerolineaceae bacterium]|nr:MAG: DUF4102 domain-containing protein [Anaerolineaceae bacterium]